MSLEYEDLASTAEIPLCVGQCWDIPQIDEELGTISVCEILSFNENKLQFFHSLDPTITKDSQTKMVTKTAESRITKN